VTRSSSHAPRRSSVAIAAAALAAASLGSAAAAGCGSAAPAPAPASCAPRDAIVAVSDYTSSGVGAIALDGGVDIRVAADLGKDPQLESTRGRAFFVARFDDALFELDPACGAARAKIPTNDPSFTGTTNPQDVAAAADGTLWVPRFNEPSLLVLDADGGVARSIDLSSYDPDGNPNASAIRITDVGGAEKAFVVLERLDDKDRLRSKLPSALLRVDVATRSVDDAPIPLAARNPLLLVDEALGSFFLASPGNFDDVTEDAAGIERFEPEGPSTRLLASEKALGGSATLVAVTRGCGAAIVAGPTDANATSLVTFDPDTGAVFRAAANAVLATDGFDLKALAWRGDALLVGDGRRAAGGYPVHVFDRANACDLTMRPDAIFVPLPPVGLRAIP